MEITKEIDSGKYDGIWERFSNKIPAEITAGFTEGIYHVITKQICGISSSAFIEKKNIQEKVLLETIEECRGEISEVV